ncbi:unnamed protein product [Adineta steineri]|uniref:G-protein coupled receptors family 1 profile domain-containing protein n=2 Tax=Adineta steineri TaxID=433720 RepID=A0A815J7E5_9BILA|nr:unnamed protein product [Adineta steineri]CAF1454213.1 unnamed protein product [Adineta steineri]
MDITSIKNLRTSITFITPYIMLILGNIGCICNFLTFTAKQLRQNSCGWYFLMSALFDFIFLNIGLFTKLASEQYGSTLDDTNIIWCRMRAFLTWVLPCISTDYIVLASLDRCLSTSTNTRFRSFSQIKIAYRMTYIPIILNSLASFHQLIYYEHRPKCYPRAGIYSYFLSMYSIFWTSLIPQSSMFIFGLITYYNIHKSRQRLMNTIQQQQQRNRTDSHMIRITLIQVISSSILLNIRTVYYSYTVITTNDRKDDYRIAIEKLLLQISSFIFYLNFSKSFFMNTLSSKLFRKVFKERLILFYRHIICLKVKVQPINTIQSNDRKMVIVPS